MFSRSKAPALNLDPLTEAETLEDCNEIEQVFSNLDLDGQAAYIKMFKATIGAVTHLAFNRAKEVHMGCMWKMVNDDGIIYLEKVVSNANQIYQLEDFNDAGVGTYVFQTYKIKIEQGIDKLAVSVQTNAGITDAFNTSKPEKLGYLVKMSIGRLSK